MSRNNITRRDRFGQELQTCIIRVFYAICGNYDKVPTNLKGFLYNTGYKKAQKYRIQNASLS